MKLDKFYSIPGFSKYLITKKGVLMNVKTKHLLKSYVDKRGYTRYVCYCDTKKKFTCIGRFRLLAIAFIPCEFDIRTMVVNHLDGNKLNDDLSNLEWTTQLGNVEHAGVTGLSKSCLPMMAMNVDTGEIKKYASAAACARDLKIGHDAVKFRLRFDDQRVYPERYQYRLGWDAGLWTINPDIEKSIDQVGNETPMQVKNITTGKVTELPSVAAVSYKTKISLNAVWVRLRNQNQPFFFPNLLVRFKYKEDGSVNEDNWRDVEDPIFEFDKQNSTSSIVLINDVTKEVKFFLYLKEAADWLGVDKGKVNKRLYSKNPSLLDGWKPMFYKNYRAEGGERISFS